MRAWMVAVAALALALGLGVGLWKHTPSPAEISAEQIYSASFPDLAGQMQPLSKWRGKILIVNFWATWCPPCREEIPAFIEAYKAYHDKDVVFVGIALDEHDAVNQFSQDVGITYPLLIGGEAGYSFAEHLGNTSGGIPFTVILDRQGQIVYVASGGMSRAELDKQIAKML